MRYLCLCFFLLCSSMVLRAQHETSIMQAPDDWISEIIPFPLGFALDIPFQGFEELRFAPSWSDSTSQEFWTYTFVWYLEGEPVTFTEAYLEEVLESYYNGLMGAVAGTGEAPEKALCLVVQDGATFVGKLRTYDSFFTRHSITLNFSGAVQFCPETQRQLLRIQLSPQPFTHPVWEKLEEVKILAKCN